MAGKAGRPRKYKTAKALKKAVEEYFASISYLDTDHGVRVTRYVKPPTMARLCLHLGVSRSTWSEYGQDEKLGPIVEQARLRAEDYWTERLTGKGAQGAKFALSACYGWREKVDVTGDGLVTVTMGGETEGAEQ